MKLVFANVLNLLISDFFGPPAIQRANRMWADVRMFAEGTEFTAVRGLQLHARTAYSRRMIESLIITDQKASPESIT